MRAKFKQTIRLLLAATFSVAIGPLAHAASFKVVVNNGVHTDSLSKKSVSDLLMKRTAKWDGGQAVVPVDQPETSAVRGDFSRAVHGKPTTAVKSYWNQQIFSGRELPPVEKSSDMDVIAFVRSTPGAIGYVSESASTEGVRVVAVQ